jgi:hypothetical protein
VNNALIVILALCALAGSFATAEAQDFKSTRVFQSLCAKAGSTELSSCYCYAAEKGSVEDLKALEAFGAKSPAASCFIYAVAQNSYDNAKHLIERGQDPNGLDSSGSPILFSFISPGCLSSFWSDEDFTKIQFLLDNGADPLIVDKKSGLNAAQKASEVRNSAQFLASKMQGSGGQALLSRCDKITTMLLDAATKRRR